MEIKKINTKKRSHSKDFFLHFPKYHDTINENMFDNYIKIFGVFYGAYRHIEFHAEEGAKWSKFAFSAQTTVMAECGSAAKPTRQAITVYSF